MLISRVKRFKQSNKPVRLLIPKCAKGVGESKKENEHGRLSHPGFRLAEHIRAKDRLRNALMLYLV